MRWVTFAAAAALVLAACGQQGSGSSLPPVQDGAQAPATQTAPSGTVQQAQLTPEQVEQVRAVVRQYLDLSQQANAAGHAPAAGFSDEIAGLQPGTDHRWQIELAAGTTYKIIGACDNECSNVDMELIDVATGGVVESDMMGDDIPIVDFTPPANGRYIVRLLMQVCTVAPCYAGARVLTGAAQSGGDK
jgi:hypothetical protein